MKEGLRCLAPCAPVSSHLTSCCTVCTRAAFAMGLLATKKDDSELAEALHLEAVLVLDRLPEV